MQACEKLKLMVLFNINCQDRIQQNNHQNQTRSRDKVLRNSYRAQRMWTSDFVLNKELNNSTYKQCQQRWHRKNSKWLAYYCVEAGHYYSQ